MAVMLYRSLKMFKVVIFVIARLQIFEQQNQ